MSRAVGATSVWEPGYIGPHPKCQSSDNSGTFPDSEGPVHLFTKQYNTVECRYFCMQMISSMQMSQGYEYSVDGIQYSNASIVSCCSKLPVLWVIAYSSAGKVFSLAVVEVLMVICIIFQDIMSYKVNTDVFDGVKSSSFQS